MFDQFSRSQCGSEEPFPPALKGEDRAGQGVSEGFCHRIKEQSRRGQLNPTACLGRGKHEDESGEHWAIS
jgi:hypothetical protein